MASIEWRPEFATGIPDVDHEHQQLIVWINQTLAASSQPATTADQVSDLLGDVFARISAHFALEERVMSERRYDQYPEHKRDHEALLDDIRDIMDDVDSIGVEDRFSARLTEWFSAHFRTHDARFHHRMPGA